MFCPFLHVTYLFFTARFWLSVQDCIPAGIPPRDHVNFNEAWSSWGYVASRTGIISSYSLNRFPVSFPSRPPRLFFWSFGLIHAATLFSSLMTGKEDYLKTRIFLLEMGFTNIFVSVFERRTSSLKAFRPFVLRFAIWSNSTRPSRTKNSRPQLYMNSEKNTRLIPRWIHFAGYLSVLGISKFLFQVLHGGGPRWS